jgi:hypothetical protein
LKGKSRQKRKWILRKMRNGLRKMRLNKLGIRTYMNVKAARRTGWGRGGMTTVFCPFSQVHRHMRLSTDGSSLAVMAGRETPSDRHISEDLLWKYGLATVI